MRREGFSCSLKWFLVLFFLKSCICQDPSCNDCCNNYTEINEPRRSINSTWEIGQTPLCDRLLPFGWYRFTSFNGTKMPEIAAADLQCGTHFPVWLKDPHPTVAEGNVACTACVSSFGNTCSHSVTIHVKNCNGDYFVYYLRPLYYCATAYCAGFGVPCPYGKVGEHPHCYDPPAQFSIDNLGLPEIGYGGEDISVTLTCTVTILNGVETWKNVSYLIRWFSEGKTLKNDIRCGGLPPGNMHQNPCPNEKLISQLPGGDYKIGQSISCEVSAKFTTSPNNVWSSPKQVPLPFFAGLEVHPTALNLENCAEERFIVTITPKIPVRRSEIFGLPKLGFETPKEALIVDGCELPLEAGHVSVQISVKAACLQPTDISVGLKPIIPRIIHVNSQFWNADVGLPTIWVNIRAKTEIQQCLSCGDPHYHPLQPLTFGQFVYLMIFVKRE